MIKAGLFLPRAKSDFVSDSTGMWELQLPLCRNEGRSSVGATTTTQRPRTSGLVRPPLGYLGNLIACSWERDTEEEKEAVVVAGGQTTNRYLILASDKLQSARGVQLKLFCKLMRATDSLHFPPPASCNTKVQLGYTEIKRMSFGVNQEVCHRRTLSFDGQEMGGGIPIRSCRNNYQAMSFAR